MGQKTNPIGNRLGIIRGWESNWYGGKSFGNMIAEDDKIRKYIFTRLAKASVSRVIIERTLKILTITITTARPGIIIGKAGQEVDKLKEELKVDYKLVLAGSTYINGDNKVLLKIEKYIAEHNLFTSILMPGYIDKNKALYFYNNSLMYVFPSIDEGFGIPLIEALKLKVPVICSDIPIFREIAHDSVLYFEKQNEINLFERMKELIQSKELSSKLVSKGIKRVKKFNRYNFIKDIEKIY